MSSKVSFTVRRPSPLSRASSGPDSDTGTNLRPPRRLAAETSTPGSPLAKDNPSDSSDEDSVVEDELVTGFDKFGVFEPRHKCGVRNRNLDFSQDTLPQ